MRPLMPSVDTPDKLFHDGDPTQGIEGTIVEAEFMNNHQAATQSVQQELINVLAAAAMQPDPTKQDQLVTAIRSIINAPEKGWVQTVNGLSPDENGAVSIKVENIGDAGTAAKATVVTSPTDTTAGRVLAVGYGGWGIKNGTAPYLASIFDIACSGMYAALGKGSTTPTEGMPDDSGNTRYGVLAANIYTDQYWVTLISNREYYVGNVNAANRSVTWYRFYNTAYKPTAADTGALPVFTNNLSVDLNTLGNMNSRGIYCQGGNANATAANHYPIQQAGTLYCTPSAYGCQQMYVTYANRIFLRGLTGVYTGTGPWTEWAEMYGPFNKPTAADTNAVSKTGDTMTGALGLSMVAPNIGLQCTNDDTRQYIMAKKKDASGSWYVGKANANSESLMLWNYQANSGIEVSADGRIHLNSKGKQVILNPDGAFDGEIIGKSTNNFRIVYGNYGAFWRQDGINLYLMLTNSGDQYGAYNALRPFAVNLATGDVTIGKLGLVNYANFDARYYTQTAANAKFVQGVQWSAEYTKPYGGGASVKANAGGAMTGLQEDQGDNEIKTYYFKTLQVNVNGAWKNVAG